MSLTFLPYAKQSIREEDLQAAQEALKADLITRGPPVQLFEEKVATYCDVPYAVMFQSGTAALMAAYFAADLTTYDRVFSSPMTFIATVGAPIQRGMRPHYIDIERSTGNISLEKLKEALNYHSSRGRPVIVPVHFGGVAVDMAALNAFIKHPDAVIIEDAAHAIGSCYPSGERVGSCLYSQMTIFSFHPAKTLTTGEGGMVTTCDPHLYHRLLLFRDNGIERTSPYLKREAALGYYEVHAISGNFNVTSFQAALGISQFNRLDSFIAKRRLLVQHYRRYLRDLPHVQLMTDQQDEYTAFHLMVVQIDFEAYKKTRLRVMQALKERGIGTQVHYIPLYHHPVTNCDLEEMQERYPETETYYRQALTLPLYYELTEEDVHRVCRELKAALKN